MTTHNANNERIKRRYFAYLKEAKRHSEPTVDAVAKALARFEVDTKHRDFKAFHFEQAIAFKKQPGRAKEPAVRGEAEQGDPERDAGARQSDSSTGSPGSPATSRGFSIPTPTISICRKRTCALRRPSANRSGRPWSR